MNGAFLVAAAVLTAALLPLAAAAARVGMIDGLVALELAGILTTLALVCLSVGLGSTASTGVALVAAVLTLASGLIYARFMDRRP